jgi:hypothetical protein
MAKIRGQKWQLRTEVNVLFAPQKKPQAGKRMTKVMEPDAFVACALNTCNFQCLVEGCPEGGDRIAPSAWTGKQGDVRKGGSEMPGCNSPALKETLDQVRGNRDYSRFIELAVPDTECTGVEIDIGMCEPQQLSRAQSSEVQNSQRSPEYLSAYWRCATCWQLSTCLKETAALISIKHTRDKFRPHNP